MEVRRPSPGAGRYRFPDTEEPTQPGHPETDGRAPVLQRLYANLTPEERHRLVLLADSWFRCDANGRALVEGVAGELAKRPPG